ncbi:hypothetical protein QBC43DRAFT_349760, partial [Cladorrhinum sp. PSN259]
VTTSFPPPPTVPYPKPKFPLRTASKERPSLEIYTGGPEKVEALKFKLQTPQMGVLGLLFMFLRLCLFGFLIAAIALFVNGMNKITTSQPKPPAEFVGGVTVTGLASVYVVITFILYQVNLMPPLLTGIFDALFWIASIVVAALVGKSFPKLKCDTLNPQHSLATHLKLNNNTYSAYVSFDSSTCNESKAVWGVYIAICLFFVFSTAVCVGLWYREVAGTFGGVMKQKQSWETDVSLGTKSMNDTGAPRFSQPPLVPLRELDPTVPNGLGIRISTSSRYSCDTDASSILSELTASPPQRGLRPPPLRINPNKMPTIAGSPTDETDVYGISPLMAGAPGPAPAPAPASVIQQSKPEQQNRVPKSPLSPIKGFLASRQKRKSVAAPPPIITNPPRQSKFREEKTPDVAIALQTVGLTPPPLPVLAMKPIKRKTVWGVIDGWWDLGLVERMNTIKRKNVK